MSYIKSYQICGIPLIKFQSLERIQAIQQGTLYMKSCAWYRQFEDTDDAIGDTHEALLPIAQASFSIPELGITQRLENTGVRTAYSDDFAFCMLGINSDNASFSFSDEQKTKVKGFGDTALIITDYGEFINRVTRAAQEKGHKVNAGFVLYYNETIDTVDNFILLMKDMRNVAFLKRRRYYYQQEFRFVIHNPNETQDYMLLDNVGSIADISFILSTDAVLNGLAEIRTE